MGNYHGQHKPNDIITQEVNGKVVVFYATHIFEDKRQKTIIVLQESHDDMWEDDWVYTAQRSVA